MRVQKRDGTLQLFDGRKIIKALHMANHDGEPLIANGDVNALVNQVTERVAEQCDGDVIGIEKIQDLVEEELMKQYQEVAKRYIVYRHEHAKAREERRKPDPNALADYIHLSKYSRYDSDLERRETFSETVSRVKAMHLLKYQAYGRYTNKLIEEAFEFVYAKKVLPSMRSMQFAGKAIEDNNARLYNCAYTLADRPEAFGQILYLLLCGCGVGYSVQWSHIDKLPKLAHISKSKVFHWVVQDTIEGWGDAVKMLMTSFVEGFYIEFSFSKIRPEGSPLVTSGGRAPGHLPLKRSLENIRGVLEKAQGRKLRPIECHDIICYLAEAVLAGGIRRSSLMCIFSANDTEMLYAKAAGNYDPMALNAQRAMANNAAMLLRSSPSRHKDFKRIITIAEEGYGDPGFFLSDDKNYGCNPCGEIGLHPRINDQTGFSFCNLCEINAAACEDPGDFVMAAKAAAVIGTLQAGYNKFPYLGSTTEAIAARDALLGVGITGMMDNPKLAFDPQLQQAAAAEVLNINSIIAEQLGINPAKRATTIKPGGTAPLELGGVACGIHPHHAPRYFRRVTANPLEPALIHFRKYNPHMVEEKPNGDLCIVFPVEAPEGSKFVKDMPAKEFMQYIFSTYNNWVAPGTRDKSEDLTHNVSATVTMHPEEKDGVVKDIESNIKCVAAMSFAPHLLDKKFPFAPREEVTAADESKWNYLIKNYVPVDWTKMQEPGMEQLDAGIECSGQRCEI